MREEREKKSSSKVCLSSFLFFRSSKKLNRFSLFNSRAQGRQLIMYFL